MINGRTVVEKAFTSTDVVSVPDNFKGNVEFRIWDAVGAFVADISPERDETELLINAGTLFKVLRLEMSGTVNVIELQQIK